MCVYILIGIDGDLVRANNRTGGFDVGTAYDGVNHETFYTIPSEFFTGGEVERHDADTPKDVVGVLDQDGVVREVSAGGIRIKLPNIPEIGILRQRYPVMPLRHEGTTEWKELEALKDYIFNIGSAGSSLTDSTSLENGLSLTLKSRRDGHSHIVHIKPDVFVALHSGNEVWVETEMAEDHKHRLLMYFEERNMSGDYMFKRILPNGRHLPRLGINI